MDIRSFEFAVKAKQSRTALEAVMAQAWEKFQNAGTGSDGDQFEIAVKQVASAGGVKIASVTASGKVDLIVFLADPLTGKKRRYRIEIKSGSGIVATLKPRLGLRNISEYSEADILPGADLVVYAAKPGEFETLDDLLDGTVVLTRAEFIAMVSGAGGKKKSGFETCFTVQCNNTALVEKNKQLTGKTEIWDEAGKKVLDENGDPVLLDTIRQTKKPDKETGEIKWTRRGCPRWTDCIVMQTSYLDARAEAVELGLAMGEMVSLRTWLEDNGRA